MRFQAVNVVPIDLNVMDEEYKYIKLNEKTPHFVLGNEVAEAFAGHVVDFSHAGIYLIRKQNQLAYD